MKDIIIEKSKNIGALCGFLKSPKNKEYSDYIDSNLPEEIVLLDVNEKLWYYLNDVKEIKKCNCGDKLTFFSTGKGYAKTCGKKECKYLSMCETSKSDETKEKRKNTIKEKYGVEHQMQSDFIKDKFKKTMIGKYGVEWASQSDEIKEKIKISMKKSIDGAIEKRKKTWNNKSSDEKEEAVKNRFNTIEKNWGSKDNFYKNVAKKVKEKSIQNYGVEHHFKLPEIIKKRIDSYVKNIDDKIKTLLPEHITYIERKSNINNTDSIICIKCNNCLVETNITRQYLYHRCSLGEDPCLTCNPKLHGTSKSELEVLEYIKSIYSGEIIHSYKDEYEIDIYLPEFNVGFEYNGLYWHSEIYKDKNFHINKTKYFNDKEIRIIHIWEDDWLYKKEIVKSRISNLINLSDKIYARKCSIYIPTNKEYKDFLINNHLQGNVNAKYKYALKYNNEIVGVISFGGLRKFMNQNSKEGEYELLRYCTKGGINIIGGPSKLLKHFIKEVSPKRIMSYSDRSNSNGNLYKKIGFEYVSLSDPGYYYVINEKREHRYKWRKSELIKLGGDPNLSELEIMNKWGYYRIYDCGVEKWEYNFNI